MTISVAAFLHGFPLASNIVAEYCELNAYSDAEHKYYGRLLAIPGYFRINIVHLGDDAGAGGNGADLPALADRHIDGRQTFERTEPMTTPDDGMKIRLEK